MTDHILICDDEPDLREMVGEYFRTRGYEAELAGDGAALFEAIARRVPDLVILDVRMPGEDGLSVLRRLRAQGELPVVMLTAADDVVDRIVGLEIGADDYLGKPVDLRELEARVRTILRRQRRAAPVADGPETVHRFGPFAFDVSAARLSGPEGDIELTAMEIALLNAFLENRGRVLSRDRLLDLAHHGGWEPLDRSIDLRISRLRRKIESDPARPRWIRTVRGLGYQFVAN
ncbi:response regulator [Roseobacter sp. HKCCA0434]|uniref:response regulator n=1 Tax=Roseobacter sp. HKCCA0434 TaxID=3079297 RepID=UPI002905CDA9|nr:response regulator [Roseobacter sp. HKCCA0434]